MKFGLAEIIVAVTLVLIALGLVVGFMAGAEAAAMIQYRAVCVSNGYPELSSIVQNGETTWYCHRMWFGTDQFIPVLELEQ